MRFSNFLVGSLSVFGQVSAIPLAGHSIPVTENLLSVRKVVDIPPIVVTPGGGGGGGGPPIDLPPVIAEPPDGDWRGGGGGGGGGPPAPPERTKPDKMICTGSLAKQGMCAIGQIIIGELIDWMWEQIKKWNVDEFNKLLNEQLDALRDPPAPIPPPAPPAPEIPPTPEVPVYQPPPGNGHINEQIPRGYGEK